MEDAGSYTIGLSGTWYSTIYTIHITQEGPDVTATCDGVPWSPTRGVVVGNVITLHFPQAMSGRIYFDGEYRVIRWNSTSLWTRRSRTQVPVEPAPIPPEDRTVNFGVLFPGRSFGVGRDMFVWNDMNDGEFSMDVLALFTNGMLDPGTAELESELPRRMCFYLTTPLPQHIANLQLYMRGEGPAVESHLISTVDNLRPSVDLDNLPWRSVLLKWPK
ncbi:hypothetical protein CYMTET_22981 [Cymbomonas tetramitiformis]|uniref:Uncharacterized protein n=1 Tax=Cymbomonas tetramitiformis TaxID=36881 RepID=A0AAE0G0A4_9CHLO|nr:hypothetical protein CYMTET_22981 [Cymbomonas tetramitiformis]